MKYHSIITATSKYLRCMSIDRQSTKKSINPYMPVFFKPVLLHEKVSKIIYNVLNEKEVIPTSMGKWEAELSPYGVDDISVQEVFKICFKTTNDSSVQWLQFRILYRIFPVRYYLE